MGRTDADGSAITSEKVRRYLERVGYDRPQILGMGSLGGDLSDELKAFGYGKPLRVRFRAGGEHGQQQDIVIRTMSADPFGHEDHADRVGNLLSDYDVFNTIPRHIEALDVGTFDAAGELIPMAHGEPFLVTNYVEGELYAKDLNTLADGRAATPQDIARARALAQYLADLHSVKADAEHYVRTLRDTVGSGEGIFGQTDAFTTQNTPATPERLYQLELQTVRWRWKLRARSTRAARTHGDFHPFNILFRADTDFSVLDCSRGGQGEPADDVTCLAINFLLFGLRYRQGFNGGYRALWDAFWETYLEVTGDRELLEVVPLFFAWRILVLTNPVWYPNLSNEARETLLTMAERLLAETPFDPAHVERLWDATP